MNENYPVMDLKIEPYFDKPVTDLAFAFDLGAVAGLKNYAHKPQADLYADHDSAITYALLQSGSAYEEVYNISSVDHVSPYEKRQQYADQIERGFMPLLGNGFQFVIDRRPEGEESGFIPAVEYTRYFSEGKIPIADKDHKLHTHDIAHISSYAFSFGCTAFAELARTAATNALSDPVHCETFTKAMDGFGDNMRNLEEDQHDNQATYIGNVNGIRLSLSQLSRLKHLNDETYTPDDEQALITQIENSLGVTRARLDAVSRYNTHHIY